MAVDPNAWAGVLSTTGAAGLALIVLVVLLAATFTASVTLITLLIRHLLADERIPAQVWADECAQHAREMETLTVLTGAVSEMTWTLRLLANKAGVST